VSEYALYHGDCLEVMPTLAGGSIDAMICDPPYGTTACKWDSVIPFEPMWRELKRLIKPRGAIVLFGSQPFTSALVMSNPKWFRYEWVWDKKNSSDCYNGKIKPLPSHENILVFSDGTHDYHPIMTAALPHNVRKIPAKPKPTGGVYGGAIGRASHKLDRYPLSVIEYNRRSVELHATKRLHPTQKPLALLEYLIRTYTNAGDTVLDFTMGSGTTGHACGNLGRRFIGIERDESYFNLASERIATAYAPLRAMQVAV